MKAVNLICVCGESLLAHLVGVEVGLAGDLDVVEKALVAIGGDWVSEAIRTALTVRANGSDTKEEGLVGVDTVLKELKRAVANVVSGVGSLHRTVLFVIEGHDRIQVFVRSGVDENYVALETKLLSVAWELSEVEHVQSERVQPAAYGAL